MKIKDAVINWINQIKSYIELAKKKNEKSPIFRIIYKI